MSVYDTAVEESDESTENDQSELWTYGEAVTERASESGCSHGVDNCPGPNPEIHIEDGKAVIDGTIPCVGCYMDSLHGEDD